MAELFERLDTTGALLSSAIDQYLDACAAIHDYSQPLLAGVSRAFFDRVVSELPLVTSHETKIKQAKATIGYIINTSSPVSHINSLPPEILTRIFCMVTDACGLIHDVGNSIPLPRYPDYLSHVCSRWRQVALDSPSLWAHIDLVRLSVPNRGFKPRAETFVSRAGTSLLDFHIYEQRDCHVYDHQSMLDIITLTGPRSRSLQIVTCHMQNYGYTLPLIAHCFNTCVSGTLTKLDITQPPDWSALIPRDAYFIDSRDYSSHTPPSPYSLDVAAERLDALLRPITHLQLNGVYFPWTHRAYHGLVELRLLMSGSHPISITQPELVDILATSPRLKVLHFEINILDQHSADSAIAPVRLDDLEVLTVHPWSDSNPHVILALLAPGSKPLRFSFALGDNVGLHGPQENWQVQLKDFFKRSNITELRLRGIDWPLDAGPENILGSLPNLRVLVLQACADGSQIDTAPFPPPNPDLPHLDVMYMAGCLIKLHSLVRTLKHLRVRRVVFWNSNFPSNDEALRNASEEMELELGTDCPSFIWINRYRPSPIEYWD